LKNQTPNVFINTIVCLRSIAGRSHDAPGAPSHSGLGLLQHSRLDLSHRLGDLAARGTLIGHAFFGQDLGLSWKSASSRAGCVYCMRLTEAWTSTSLTGRCGRIVTLSDENRGTSGVRLPDEHSKKSRITSCRSGSSCAVWVSSGGTGFPTMGAARTVATAASAVFPAGRHSGGLRSTPSVHLVAYSPPAPCRIIPSPLLAGGFRGAPRRHALGHVPACTPCWPSRIPRISGLHPPPPL